MLRDWFIGAFGCVERKVRGREPGLCDMCVLLVTLLSRKHPHHSTDTTRCTHLERVPEPAGRPLPRHDGVIPVAAEPPVVHVWVGGRRR